MVSHFTTGLTAVHQLACVVIDDVNRHRSFEVRVRRQVSAIGTPSSIPTSPVSRGPIPAPRVRTEAETANFCSLSHSARDANGKVRPEIRRFESTRQELTRDGTLKTVSCEGIVDVLLAVDVDWRGHLNSEGLVESEILRTVKVHACLRHDGEWTREKPDDRDETPET
jgi:hypothetical protein